MARSKTSNIVDAKCMAALKQFEGLSSESDTNQEYVDSFAKDLLNYLSTPCSNTKLREECLKRVTLILENCDEAQLAMFASSSNFLKSLEATITSYQKSVAYPTSGNIISHEAYHHTLVCALTLIEPTTCLRLFVKYTKTSNILKSLVTHLCEIFKSDLAFFTQEMALDMICRVFIVSTKLKDMELVNAVKKALPTSFRVHFNSINSCICILKDMREAINEMNRETDNKNISSFLVSNVYISIPPSPIYNDSIKSDNPGNMEQEKILQSNCWVDFNAKAITFLQKAQSTDIFVKIPFSDMRRVNYVTTNHSIQIAVDHSDDHLKAILKLNYNEAIAEHVIKAFISFPCMRFEFQNEQNFQMAKEVINNRIDRETIKDNYADTQCDPGPILDPAIVGMKRQKISYATTKHQSNKDHLKVLKMHEKDNYSLTVSQEELMNPIPNSPVQVHNVSEITYTTNEIDEETVLDYTSPILEPISPVTNVIKNTHLLENIPEKPAKSKKKPINVQLRNRTEKPLDSLVTQVPCPSSSEKNIPGRTITNSNGTQKSSRNSRNKISPPTVFEQLPLNESTTPKSAVSISPVKPLQSGLRKNKTNQATTNSSANRALLLPPTQSQIDNVINATPFHDTSACADQDVFAFDAPDNELDKESAVVVEAQVKSRSDEQCVVGSGRKPNNTRKISIGSSMKLSTYSKAKKVEADSPAIDTQSNDKISTLDTEKKSHDKSSGFDKPKSKESSPFAMGARAMKLSNITPYKRTQGKNSTPAFPKTYSTTKSDATKSNLRNQPSTLALKDNSHDGNRKALRDITDPVTRSITKPKLDLFSKDKTHKVQVPSEIFTYNPSDNTADMEIACQDTNSHHSYGSNSTFKSAVIPYTSPVTSDDDQPLKKPRLTKEALNKLPVRDHKQSIRQGFRRTSKPFVTSTAPVKNTSNPTGQAISPIHSSQPTQQDTNVNMQTISQSPCGLMLDMESSPNMGMGENTYEHFSANDADMNDLNICLNGSSDSNTPPDGSDDVLTMLVNELVSMQKARIQKKKARHIHAATASTDRQIQQYIQTWSTHEIENYEADILPILQQKVDAFHTIADKCLHELHEETHHLNQSESEKREQINSFNQRISNYKFNLEKTIKSIGNEEENVIHSMKLARNKSIATTKSLFNKADVEFGKKKQQKNIKLLSTFHNEL